MAREDQQLAPIDADRLYPLELFQQIAGLGRAAMRNARKSGLNIRYVSGRGWVLGRDWIDYVVEHGKGAKDE